MDLLLLSHYIQVLDDEYERKIQFQQAVITAKEMYTTLLISYNKALEQYQNVLSHLHIVYGTRLTFLWNYADIWND